MPPPLQLSTRNKNQTQTQSHSAATAARQVQKRVDAAIGMPLPSTQRATELTPPSPPPRLIEFSKTLTTLLTSSSPRDIPPSHVLDALVDEANKHIEKLDLSCPTGGGGGGTTGTTGKNVGGGVEADGCATRLWNLCTRLRREFGSGGDDGGDAEGNGRLGRLLLCGRVLGFYLLVVVRVGSGRAGRRREVVVHLVKLGLKVARDCVGEFSGGGGVNGRG